MRVYGVYLVDDELIAANGFVDSVLWVENGFEVIWNSSNAQTAIAEIIEKKPDVVICDMMFPVWDGIELFKRLKMSGATAEFILLSVHAEFKASREFFLLDGFDYILKPFDSSRAVAVLERLISKLAAKNNEMPSIRLIPSQSESFDKLVSYVMLNYTKKLRLTDLSKRFGISTTYICSLFVKHYDSTFSQFISNLRMTESKRLISGTGTSLKEVSVLCGYPSYHHFCRVFKAHFGTPPSKYREEA